MHWVVARLYPTPKGAAPLTHVTFVLARPKYHAIDIFLFIAPSMLPICVLLALVPQLPDNNRTTTYMGGTGSYMDDTRCFPKV